MTESIMATATEQVFLEILLLSILKFTQIKLIIDSPFASVALHSGAESSHCVD